MGIIPSINEDVERPELSYTVGRNLKWHRRFGKQSWQSLKNLYIQLTYDPAIPSLGIYTI